jgi:hypothetical protein
MADSPPIGRLRMRLAAQVAQPLAVSATGRQYHFSEDAAAYSEIDIRRGEAFVVVVVIGSLPSEQFVVDVWLGFAREVWLLDPRDEAVWIARGDAPPRRLDRADVLRSAALPGVAIAVDALFALPS